MSCSSLEVQSSLVCFGGLFSSNSVIFGRGSCSQGIGPIVQRLYCAPQARLASRQFFCCIEAALLERDVVEEGTHRADVADKKTKLDNEIVEVVEVCTARQNLEDALAKVDVSRIVPSCDNVLEDSVTPTRRRAR